MKPDHILPCSCSQLNHTVRVSAWDDQVCIEFLLEPHGFWMRLKQACAVMLGRRALLQDVVVDREELSEWLKPSLGPGIDEILRLDENELEEFKAWWRA